METSRNKLEAQQPLPSCSEQTQYRGRQAMLQLAPTYPHHHHTPQPGQTRRLAILDPALQGKRTELEQSARETAPRPRPWRRAAVLPGAAAARGKQPLRLRAQPRGRAATEPGASSSAGQPARRDKCPRHSTASSLRTFQACNVSIHHKMGFDFNLPEVLLYRDLLFCCRLDLDA